MSKKESGRKSRQSLPKREVVEVFRTMHLDKEDVREQFIKMGDFGQPVRQSTYYSIQVTGTIDSFDCR